MSGAGGVSRELLADAAVLLDAKIKVRAEDSWKATDSSMGAARVRSDSGTLEYDLDQSIEGGEATIHLGTHQAVPGAPRIPVIVKIPRDGESAKTLPEVAKIAMRIRAGDPEFLKGIYTDPKTGKIRIVLENRGVDLTVYCSEHLMTIPMFKAFEAVVDLSSALVKLIAALHMEEWIHGDLKIDNFGVELDSDGKIKRVSCLDKEGLGRVSDELPMATLGYKDPSSSIKATPYRDRHALGITILQLLEFCTPSEFSKGKIARALAAFQSPPYTNSAVRANYAALYDAIQSFVLLLRELEMPAPLKSQVTVLCSVTVNLVNDSLSMTSLSEHFAELVAAVPSAAPVPKLPFFDESCAPSPVKRTKRTDSESEKSQE